MDPHPSHIVDQNGKCQRCGDGGDSLRWSCVGYNHKLVHNAETIRNEEKQEPLNEEEHYPHGSVPDLLAEFAAIYEKRNEQYGDSYKSFGNLAVAAFPDGLTVKTKEDWTRLGLIIMQLAKIQRYCLKFHDDPPRDS